MKDEWPRGRSIDRDLPTRYNPISNTPSRPKWEAPLQKKKKKKTIIIMKTKKIEHSAPLPSVRPRGRADSSTRTCRWCGGICVGGGGCGGGHKKKKYKDVTSLVAPLQVTFQPSTFPSPPNSASRPAPPSPQSHFCCFSIHSPRVLGTATVERAKMEGI